MFLWRKHIDIHTKRKKAKFIVITRHYNRNIKHQIYTVIINLTSLQTYYTVHCIMIAIKDTTQGWDKRARVPASHFLGEELHPLRWKSNTHRANLWLPSFVCLKFLAFLKQLCFGTFTGYDILQSDLCCVQSIVLSSTLYGFR